MRYLLLQFGGPDGEIGAAMRYLNQRYAMPYKECKAILTDIGILFSIMHLIGRTGALSSIKKHHNL